MTTECIASNVMSTTCSRKEVSRFQRKYVTHMQFVLQQNSAVNPLQGQSTPPDGFDETEVQCYIVLNRLLSVNDDTYSFKGKCHDENVHRCPISQLTAERFSSSLTAAEASRRTLRKIAIINL